MMTRKISTSLDDAFLEEPAAKSSGPQHTSAPGSKDYDWIDDAFDESSNANSKMSTKSKAFVGCGCLVALVVLGIVILMAIGVGADMATDLMG